MYYRLLRSKSPLKLLKASRQSLGVLQMLGPSNQQMPYSRAHDQFPYKYVQESK
jgi:hypothetical protein